MNLCKFFRNLFKKKETPIEPTKPMWEKTKQNLWWQAASIHGDNSPSGTPAEFRKVWDDIVQIDPNAPMEYRPFYAIKMGGLGLITKEVMQEIKEQTEKGFRVIYTRKEGRPTNLLRDCIIMRESNSLPWGVGLWNELEFGGKITPEEFRGILVDAGLVNTLNKIQKTYAVHVSPPGLSSFKNVFENGYGEVIKELFKDIPNTFLKVHSYGHIQPKHWVNFGFRKLMGDATGLTDIIIEENANDFVGEHKPNKPGVSDEQGAEFMRAAMYAGMQENLPVCHFMLYHKWHHYNDISDPEYGKLRREVANKVFDDVAFSGDINPRGALVLENPRGKDA